MRIIKLILIIQAIITLVIGMVFFAQFISLKLNQTSVMISESMNRTTNEFSKLKSKLELTGYLLIVIALIELIIIIRLVS